MKRMLFGVAGLIALLVIAAAVHWRPDRALRVASGLMAHNL
jgi:hypothetical protein